MSQFNYTLPSGAKFTMQAPAGTTQAQADYIFYSQVAAGALVGFKPGQSVSSTSSELAKFTLSRLDRGTAGVSDTVILAIINGMVTINGKAAVYTKSSINNNTGTNNSTTYSIATVAPFSNIPSLINVPLQNPVTQADITAISSTGFVAPAIGPLTSTQTQALMAQVSNIVDQPATTATDTTGVGKYGLSCLQLEIAGYVKPGTWQQFIQNGPSTTIEVLSAPAIWTGLNGIFSLTDFLNSSFAQNDAQATLMKNGYNSLQAAGVITTPAAQSVSAVVGTVYTGSNNVVANVTATLNTDVTSQVAALVTNSSQYGTQLTAQWASGLPPASGATTNTISITGSQPAATTSSLGSTNSLSNNINLNTITAAGVIAAAGATTAMDLLGKAAQFASGATSSLSAGVNGLSLSSISDSLSNISLSSIGDSIASSAGALANQVEGAVTNLASSIQGQATALLNSAEAQASALLTQAENEVNSLISEGEGLIASVQKAAGFANTVDRSTVDTAFTKILGSSKISVPSFGADLPSSASIGAALDISQAQNMLQGLQSQATGLASQIQGQAAGALGGAVTQAQNAVGSVPVFSSSQVNQILG
jgi:hypothetical protein